MTKNPLLNALTEYSGSMKITVDAKAGAKREGVTELAPLHFRVAVHEPPLDGKANSAILKALGKHLGLAPSQLIIVSGSTSRRKLVQVIE